MQAMANQRLRVVDISKAAQLVILYQEGNLVFWNQNDWSMSHSIQSQVSAKQFAMESSSRFIALLTEEGSV